MFNVYSVYLSAKERSRIALEVLTCPCFNCGFYLLITVPVDTE